MTEVLPVAGGQQLGAVVIAALLLSATTTVAAAEVYTWVDEDGQVHYSDQWKPGCEEVQLPAPPAARPVSPSPPVAPPEPEPAPFAQPAEPEEPVYKLFRVVSPKDDECLLRIGGIVKVMLEVDPAPRQGKLLQDPGHRLLVNLDGAPLGSDYLVGLQDGALTLFLTDVYRGTHRLDVTITDAQGTSLARTPLVNFHVQQFSPSIYQQQRDRRRGSSVVVPPPSTNTGGDGWATGTAWDGRLSRFSADPRISRQGLPPAAQ